MKWHMGDQSLEVTPAKATRKGTPASRRRGRHRRHCVGALMMGAIHTRGAGLRGLCILAPFPCPGFGGQNGDQGKSRLREARMGLGGCDEARWALQIGEG